MKKILIIDNYDSFTYNLVHLVEEIVDQPITVKRNDEVTIAEIDAYDYIILSPGPGIPDEAGLLKEIIKTYASSKKIFGVCLGLQAIGEVFGSTLKNLASVYHGIQTDMIVTDPENLVFQGIEPTFPAGRYHSWVIDKDHISDDLLVTCVDDLGEIMAIQHKTYNISAVQFHPESIMTPSGKQMVHNFLDKA